MFCGKRTLVALAVGTSFVCIELEEALEGLLVLSGALGGRIGRPPRHGFKVAGVMEAVVG